MEFKKDIHGEIQNFSYWHRKFNQNIGIPDSVLEKNQKVLDKYRNILPDELLSLWEKYGFTSFLEGGFYLTNPDDYTQLLKEYLTNTPLANRDDLYIVVKDAFGVLYIWEKNKGEIATIDLLVNMVFFSADVDRKFIMSREEENLEMSSFLALMSLRSIDKKDKNDNMLFQRCFDKFGRVESNQMYGYKLLSPLGGEKVIKNFDKVDLFVYADIQLSIELPTFSVIDLENMFYGF